MRQVSCAPSTMTVHVPMKFAMRGGRKTVISDVTPAPASPARTENALLKALAKAYRWRKQIEAGEYASITELAKAYHVNESYACRVLRLTLLSPHIVLAILDGRHDADLMLKEVVKPMPVVWSHQITALKIRS